MAFYELDTVLPTNGYHYGGEIKDVRIRNISTNEEKKIFGSTSEETIDAVLRDCIVEPKNLNPDTLVVADKHYLLMQLRIHTYGSEYHLMGDCPECGEKEYKINLDDFDIHYLEESIEPLEVQLPMSKDEIEIRILTSKDFKKIRTDAKRIAKKTGGSSKEIEYMFRLARLIKTVNGNEITEAEARKYVQDLHGRDSATLQQAINKVKLGYSPTITIECGCGRDLEVPLQLTSEFFRPRY